jgi:hypothetical protein
MQSPSETISVLDSSMFRVVCRELVVAFGGWVVSTSIELRCREKFLDFIT